MVGTAQKRARGEAAVVDAADCTALHRSRMFSWKPAAVVAISACPGGPMVAVGYESGDLELWDLGIMACIQRVAGQSIEVTCLAWALDGMDQHWRTFVSHLDGMLSEVDWRNSMLTAPTDSTGGVIWALATQPLAAVKPGFPHQLAAACDDGSVRLFGVEGGEPGAQLERTLTVLQGRLLSCAWHPSGEALAVGGGDGSIHMLDATTGLEIIRITAGSSSTAAPCIWRLLVLADGTLVSGDGEGAVQMWDGAFGTLLHRFQRHKADVLALAAAPDGSAVFAAGVDAQVAMFAPVAAITAESGRSAAVKAAGSSTASWAYLDNKRPHTHDVRAMDVVILAGGRAVLVSGGLDAQLVAYPIGGFLKEHPVRLSRAPQRPMCHLAAAMPGKAPVAGGSRRLSVGAVAAALPPLSRMLCSSNGTCDVWQLGQHAQLRPGGSGAAIPSRSRWQTQQQGEGFPVDLTSDPRHLAQITLGGGARVACSAISPDGTMVSCCSGTGSVRLYRLSEPAVAAGALGGGSSGRLHVERMRMPAGTERATALALTRRHLVAAHPDGSISCFELPSVSRSAAEDKEGAEEEEAATTGTEMGAGGSSEARLVARSTAQEAATGMSQERHRLSWRQYHSQASALTASPDGTLLAVAGCAGLVLLRLPTDAGIVSAPLPALLRLSKMLRTPHDAPLSGLSFSADGRLLAGALASGNLAVYDVEAARPLQWCLDNDVEATRCLSKLPGALAGCSFHPDPEVQELIAYGPGGFCHFDLTLPPDTAHMDVKRRRSKLPPDDKASASESRGRNGRVILLPDPCVYAGYLSADAVLVLEKPWEDVTRGFAPPLLRHRYGA